MTGILMVTGAYWPELSGGGLQCRTMIQALQNDFRFRVFTTCIQPAVPLNDVVDGISITRVFVDVTRPITKVRAALATIAFFLRHHASFQIVHLHGFSQKSVLIALLARLFGKRLVITIHTAEHDEPAGVQRLGPLAYWCYRQADRFIAVSDRVGSNAVAAGLPADRLATIPNGVDTGRFAPATAAERAALRRELGSLPADLPWILFVGFFSIDKRPDLAFAAWLKSRERGPQSALLLVGATSSAYHEVDPSLAQRIRDEAARRGVSHLVHFAGEVPDVERYYRAADIFVMPSIREAFGMALVEAMATALPVVSTCITGVTDRIVDDGVTGMLVAADDVGEMAAAIATLTGDRERAARMGSEARARTIARFGLAVSAERWRRAYHEAMA